MSIGSSPEPGIIRSLFLDKNGFERVVFVLLIISLITSFLYVVYSSPYKMHGNPSLDKSDFDNPFPLKNRHISLSLAILANW